MTMPNGPCVEDVAADDAGIGEARQQQRVGPDEDADRHAGDARPRAVPRRQIRPPKNAGASCATAAKDSRPIEASCASPADR